MRCRERFGSERESSCRLGSDESQDQDRYGHETEEDEKKNDEKADTSNNETRWCVTISANIGRGFLIGGAASMAKAVNDSKATRHQLEELQRHDRTMEQGLYLAPYKYRRGLYLGPYKHGGCSCKEKKKHRKDDKNAATTNVQLNELARRMRVSYFSGVFMRNTLLTSGAHRNESGIVNLDKCNGAWYSLDSVREEKQPRVL